jgi:hypothetical protein
MHSLSITKHIEIRWEIEGIEGYFFGDDKNLYNIKTGRIIKQTINCYSNGYWIKKKFYTFGKLKPLLTRPQNYNVPF